MVSPLGGNGLACEVMVMSVCSHGSLPLAGGAIHLQLLGCLQFWLGIGPSFSWLNCKIPCSLVYRAMSTCMALGLWNGFPCLPLRPFLLLSLAGVSGFYPSCGLGLLEDNVLKPAGGVHCRKGKVHYYRVGMLVCDNYVLH